MRIIVPFVIIGAATCAVVDRKLKEKSFDFSTFYTWFLYTLLYFLIMYKSRNMPMAMVALTGILFLNRQISTPIDFCLNSMFTLVTTGNKEGMQNMCKNLFINNTRYRHNLWAIPNRPTIWILNYPKKNWVEYYTQSLLPQNYVFFANKKFGRILKNYYGDDRVHCINFSKRGNYQVLKTSIRKILDSGLNVCMYFDTKIDYRGIKKHTYTLQTPRTGIFNIAKELNREITPIVIDHLYISNGIIPLQNFEIHVGSPVKIITPRDVENTISFFKNRLRSFMTNKFRL